MAAEKATTAVAKPSAISTDDLRSIPETWDDAIKSVQQMLGGQLATADEELGDGFAQLPDKSMLIGKPCLFVDWAFSQGDFGPDSEFVTVRVITTDDGKATVKRFFTDGSTGVYRQLRDYTDSHSGSHSGLFARKGLRRSDYTNEYGPATTYYIDTGV